MLGYAKDIRPMFRRTDVDAMKPRGLDLWSYTDVSASADEILSRLQEARCHVMVHGRKQQLINSSNG